MGGRLQEFSGLLPERFHKIVNHLKNFVNPTDTKQNTKKSNPSGQFSNEEWEAMYRRLKWKCFIKEDLPILFTVRSRP